MKPLNENSALLLTLAACVLLGGGTYLFLTRNHHSQPPQVLAPPVSQPVAAPRPISVPDRPAPSVASPAQQLFEAAAKGEMVNVNLLIMEHPELINETNGNAYGSTPLHFAAYNGQGMVIGTLLVHGANINARNNRGLTPLMDAAGNGKKAAVQVLLANSADTSLKNDSRQTALDLARAGHWEEIVAMLEPQAQLAQTTLRSQSPTNPRNLARQISDAADKGHLETVSNLLSAHPELINTKLGNAFGSPPLIEASYFGHEEVVAWLLAHGADVNAQNNRHWTALMLAAQNGHAGVVRQLLASQADTAIVNQDGYTALAYAQAGNRVEVVSLLETYAKQSPGTPARELKWDDAEVTGKSFASLKQLTSYCAARHFVLTGRFIHSQWPATAVSIQAGTNSISFQLKNDQIHNYPGYPGCLLKVLKLEDAAGGETAVVLKSETPATSHFE